MPKNQLLYKQVCKENAELLYSLIVEMATYEKDLHEVETTPQKISDTLCGQSNAAACIVYKDDCPAAYIIYFYTYSSYLGKQNLYIEDIYIRPEFRKLGLGREIMSFAAKMAIEKGCARMDWTCLDWNQNARDFYTHLGAEHLENRLHYRAEKESLLQIANH